MRIRHIETCHWCRESKRRCDKAKPTCSRCSRAGISCSFETLSGRTLPLRGDGSSPEVSSPDLQSFSQSTPLDTSPSGSFNGATTPLEKVKRKRNRGCLSCTRCHRLKVKCDKKSPCSRCSSAGIIINCRYTHQEHTSSRSACPADPVTSAGESIEAVLSTWFWRRQSSTHFRTLISRIESLAQPGTSHFELALQTHAKMHATEDLVLPGNFPLGSPQALKYSSLETVIALVKTSKPHHQSYIEHYLRSYQPIYPILDVDSFLEDIADFWKETTPRNLSWLSQFLMVLGLGSFASKREPEPATEFFFASEACLAKTPFLFRPNIMVLRTVCLTIVAKQVANATCWALDSCWSLTGLIVRVAMMLGLDQNREPSAPSQISDMQKEMSHRHCLWTVVIYFDIQMSMITGMPSALPQGPAGFDQGYGSTMNKWDWILSESLPVISHALSRANSNVDEMTYDEVLRYDREIRRLMHNLVPVDGEQLLRLSLDIFFRRILMVIHRCHALHPNAPTQYSISYWSSLECSLALLVHHRALCDDPALPNDIGFVSRFFVMDFFAAALTICIHLHWKDAPLSATATPEGLIPPRQTILDTIRSCQSIWARDENKSACLHTGCRILESSLSHFD
ncbi:hypothetical protein BCR34DRAFT_619533 [Clohesyomyces aquaticus]|uniref:Zn(2)-C6 fungal-type domain-containing protein n=1 Tax=Clohesyomyces aquaticus TaxID=1231657 RepID=A0A1Y1YG59_9PLEO|nr:hypothetical protein BCR34DRAFT_619533 [Clohesyomyces aquaticus]